MTQMHERYAYAALILLVLLLPERRIALAVGRASAVVFTLNLVAAIPPTPEIGAMLPVAGVLGVVGSFVMLGLTVALLAAMARPRDAEAGRPGGGSA